MKIQYMKEKKKFKNYYYLSNLYIQDFKKNKITINPEDSLICMGKISKLNNQKI